MTSKERGRKCREHSNKREASILQWNHNPILCLLRRARLKLLRKLWIWGKKMLTQKVQERMDRGPRRRNLQSAMVRSQISIARRRLRSWSTLLSKQASKTSLWPQEMFLRGMRLKTKKMQRKYKLIGCQLTSYQRILNYKTLRKGHKFLQLQINNEMKHSQNPELKSCPALIIKTQIKTIMQNRHQIRLRSRSSKATKRSSKCRGFNNRISRGNKGVQNQEGAVIEENRVNRNKQVLQK